MAPASHRLPLPALAAVMERSGGLSDKPSLVLRSVEWPGASHVLLICLREQSVSWWWLLPSRSWGRWPKGDKRHYWKTGMLGLGAWRAWEEGAKLKISQTERLMCLRQEINSKKQGCFSSQIWCLLSPTIDYSQLLASCTLQKTHWKDVSTVSWNPLSFINSIFNLVTT